MASENGCGLCKVFVENIGVKRAARFSYPMFHFNFDAVS